MAPKPARAAGKSKAVNADPNGQQRTTPKTPAAKSKWCRGTEHQVCIFSTTGDGSRAFASKGFTQCLICDDDRRNECFENPKKLKQIRPVYNGIRNSSTAVISAAFSKLSQPQVLSVLYGGSYCAGSNYTPFVDPCIFNVDHAGVPMRLQKWQEGKCNRCFFHCTMCYNLAAGIEILTAHYSHVHA